MKFTIPDKTGTVMGNAVKASPVPFREILAMQAAVKAGEKSEYEAMAEVIAGHVSTGDGARVDADELPIEAVTALFQFATEARPAAADFTPTPAG